MRHNCASVAPYSPKSILRTFTKNTAWFAKRSKEIQTICFLPPSSGCPLGSCIQGRKRLLLNADNIRELARRAYVVNVIQTFGDTGRSALERLLDGIVQIYSYCAPDLLQNPLSVCSPLTAAPNAPLINSLGQSKVCTNAKEAAAEILKVCAASECAVEICRDGTYRVLQIGEDELSSDEFLSNSIVYRYEDESDRVRFVDYDEYVPKVHSALKSSFARPTYSSLEDVFGKYTEIATNSQCRILASVWEGGVDGHRLVLVNKPEEMMRNSLSQALSMMLGGEASVRPEQNVDDTKPVDIRVEWHGSDASALIEIKWIGRSVAKPTTPEGAPYRDYGVPRAREGSRQLADYLDRNLKSENKLKPIGYHVVFDSRRRNVAGPTDALPPEDAMHFENEEIDYDPDHSTVRDDFGPYVRFFLKPRASNFAIA